MSGAILAKTSKKLGVRRRVETRYRWPRQFNWLRQPAVAFEISIEMSSPDMEHQLSA